MKKLLASALLVVLLNLAVLADGTMGPGDGAPPPPPPPPPTSNSYFVNEEGEGL